MSPIFWGVFAYWAVLSVCAIAFKWRSKPWVLELEKMAPPGYFDRRGEP